MSNVFKEAEAEADAIVGKVAESTITYSEMEKAINAMQIELDIRKYSLTVAVSVLTDLSDEDSTSPRAKDIVKYAAAIENYMVNGETETVSP